MNVLRMYNTTNYKIPICKADILSKSSFLTLDVANSTVVFVDKQVIDKFYPPEKRSTYDINCLEECFKSLSFEKNYKVRFECLERCLRKEIDINSNFVAVGLFLGRLNNEQREFLENELYKNNIKEFSSRNLIRNVILVSPERVVEWSKRLNINQKCTYLKVLFHEYAHKYFYVDGQDRYDYLDKTIEEGLANYLVLRIMGSREYKPFINLLILNQPIEYQTCYFYLEENIFYFRRNYDPYFKIHRIFYDLLDDYFYYYPGRPFLFAWKYRYKIEKSYLLDLKKAWALNLLSYIVHKKRNVLF